MRAIRLILQTLAGVLGFVGGWHLAMVVLMRVTMPSSGCDAPCDAPAYVGLGLSILAGPVVGVLTGVATALLASRVFRPKARRQDR